MKKGMVLGLLLVVLVACVPKFAPPPGCESDASPVAVPSPDKAVPDASAPAITGGAVVDTSTPAKEKPVDTDKKTGLPIKRVNEGQLVSFPNLAASDPDGDKIVYTFTPPLDQTGKWQTKVGDGGEYKVTITADDGKSKTSQSVLVIVEHGNKPPVIEKVGDVNVKEGDLVTLDPKVSDSDGDKLAITYSGWMTSNKRQTTFADQGRHVVTVSASDGKASTQETIVVIVENVNRKPVLEQISDILVKEGDKVTLRPTASDADGERVTFKYSKPFDGQGVWQTRKGDAGSYRVNVSATDGQEEVAIRFFIAVESVNQPPKLELKESVISVGEGDIVTLYPVVSDPENDPVRITYSGWMKENSYKTDFDDAGVHTVTITASDGLNKVEKTLTVNVREVNRPPVFGSGAFE
ncbi:hypothetical protein HY490_00535 [Candidatus Woesearchaeota archaeon]|nr:hypothetical protein [Candidatus Woesearchaeota archaeon]